MLSQRGQQLAKRALDVVASTVGLTVMAPTMALAAGAIRLSMGSPTTFRQRRPGLGGQPFELVKFRTMRAARPGEGPESDGLRLTRLGKLLRSLSVDELPTLFNVLRGEMSLVGPRPLLMEYLDRYSPEQARRHDVKPGITGWAQINGRNTLSWEEKFQLDVWYIDHWTLGLDLKILLLTIVKVLAREGISADGQATMSLFMGSPDPHDQEPELRSAAPAPGP